MCMGHVNFLALVLQASTHPSKLLMTRAGAAFSSVVIRYLLLPEKGQCLSKGVGAKLSLGC